jgi:sorbitol/mannitol transport system substrate-binding protein
VTRIKIWAAGLAAAIGGMTAVHAETLTIATVNNDDMIVMQKLSSKWEQQTGNKINWVILEENVLRQRVTTDIATKGGSYDVITIGAYETPIWGKKGWLTQLDDFKDYDYDDLLAPVKAGLSVDGKLYACRSTPKAPSPCIARICSRRPASACRINPLTIRSSSSPTS